MAGRPLGMDVDTVRVLANVIEAQTPLLESAQTTLNRAAAISQNPLSYLLDPGSLIVAPFSVGLLVGANLDILSARASAEELVAKLRNEALAQEWTSSATDGSYRTGWSWRTPDADRDPIGLDDIFDVWDVWEGVVGTISDVYGLVEMAWDAFSVWGKDAFAKFTKWWDSLPGWAGKLVKFSKIIPIAGSVTSGISFIVAANEGDVIGMISNGGSVVIDIVTAIVAPTGVGALIAGAVGIAWDVLWINIENGVQMVDLAANNPQAIVDYYEEYPWMGPIHVLAPITLEFWGPVADY